MPTAATPALLTVTETARMLRQHRSTIYRHVQRGELEAVRVGEHGHLRVRPRDLERLLRPAKKQP